MRLTRPLRRHGWPAAIGFGAGVAILVGGALVVLPRHPGRAPSSVAVDCGLVTCSATMPATPAPSGTPVPGSPRARVVPRGAASSAARRSPGSSRPASSARPGKPTPTSAGQPSAAPSRGPAGPAVSVTYTLVQQWSGGLEGEFTIANHGTTSITGWELSAALPGDQIESTWDATDPHPGTATLTLDPPSYQQTIAPGGGYSEFFTAGGTTISPASCTFNGAACG